jgi:hypothetical protein
MGNNLEKVKGHSKYKCFERSDVCRSGKAAASRFSMMGRLGYRVITSQSVNLLNYCNYTL